MGKTLSSMKPNSELKHLKNGWDWKISFFLLEKTSFVGARCKLLVSGSVLVDDFITRYQKNWLATKGQKLF